MNFDDIVGNIYSLLYFFNKYLLSSYYYPGTRHKGSNLFSIPFCWVTLCKFSNISGIPWLTPGSPSFLPAHRFYKMSPFIYHYTFSLQGSSARTKNSIDLTHSFVPAPHSLYFPTKIPTTAARADYVSQAVTSNTSFKWLRITKLYSPKEAVMEQIMKRRIAF